MAKISVIVPIYNAEKYLDRCIESILNQTVKDFELVLVDDGSSDNSPAICDRYAEKYDFIHVIHKPNGGAGESRNFGIERSLKTKSEYITFIDSDDFVHKQYLEVLLKALSENDVDVSTCLCRVDYEFCTSDDKSNYKVVVDSPERIMCDNLANVDIACGKLYKTECLCNFRFPTDKDYEDGFFTYRVLFASEKIAAVQCELYCYYYNACSVSHSRQSLKKVNDVLECNVLKTEYYASNGFFDAMNCTIAKSKSLFLDITNGDYCTKGYKKVVKKRQQELYKVIEKHKSHVTIPFCKSRRTYNQWINGKTDKIFDFKQDVKAVREEKGILFACLFVFKNFLKVYFL